MRLVPNQDAVSAGESLQVVSRKEKIRERSGLRLGPDIARDWSVITLLLGLAVLLPVLHLLQIGFWGSMPFFLGAYLAVSIPSAVFAAILAVLADPTERLGRITARYRNSPAKILIFLCLVFILFEIYRSWVAVLVSVLAVAILELYEENFPIARICQALLPGIILFFILIEVFSANAIAVTIRFEPNYDYALAAIDRFLLFGHSISGIAHSFARNAPLWVLKGLEANYFALFYQIGGTVIFCSIREGKEYGIRLVSTILVAYSLSVAIFFAFPTHDPYFNCSSHEISGLPTASEQLSVVTLVHARAAGRSLPLGTEYYTAFPSMHIAQPLIMLWFLRRWRRIVAVLAVIDICLVGSILLLEWHYLIDIPGGVAVAIVAIFATEYLERRRHRGAVRESGAVA